MTTRVKRDEDPMGVARAVGLPTMKAATPEVSVNRIVVTIEGGIVQSIGADRPADIEVYVVDLDVDGDHSTLCVLPEQDGDREERAYVGQPVAESLSLTETLWIAAAKANEEEED